jgi:signal recognition particle GTPase
VSIPLTPAAAPKHTDARLGAWQESSDGFRHPPQKYVSKFKKSSEKVEDTILNTILLGKLNKFSQPNYNEIKEFITHIIDSGQTEMIKCFMKLVFEKAASEEVFCPLYAKLLSELSIGYPVLLTEMANLYTQYMEIFDEVVEETSSESYNEMCKRNVEKKYRRGYSQFLAELIKNNIMDTDTFMKIILKIINQVELNRARKESIKLTEEFADCLMKIMKAIYTDARVDSDEDESEQRVHIIRATLKDLAPRIQQLSVRDPDAVGLSSKARFTFMDIYEGIQKM